ncbi:MAG TPA: molybdopterin-dependent oxidoreductase [Burkholderiales bacterium]|nr:molybdopterin-dependent oxidoreductase [Burkholderiales bacterium]
MIEKKMPDEYDTIRSTCCYCGVGCGVLIRHDGLRILGVAGDPDHPANLGKLCTKGSTLHLTAGTGGRALYPELRRNGESVRVSWESALDHAADRFAETIEKYGPDSVAFYISGQLLTEDYYVFNKLAKGLVGTNNVDTNSRLCMSSAVAGYKVTLGMDAPPACYEDIDHADCILIAGSNTAVAHPVLFRRIEAAKARRPEIRIIVVDPRKTDTARACDLHLAILPGTDVALFNGMLHVMLWEEMIDRDFISRHTENFEALKAAVREYTPREVSRICGITEESLMQAAFWFGKSDSALSLYCQGLNQSIHGTDKNASLINLHLATGKIGKPGSGPFSLTGQPNAMGGREVGGMANLLSAHRDLSNPEHRKEVAELWGVERVPEKPGKTAVELFEAIEAGEIRAVWIACTNPAQSMPDLKMVSSALEKADFVVVQDAFLGTETARHAHLLLPASAWGEKEGTVTNSERRITHVRQAVPPPGEARADWKIAVDFAQALEARLGRDAALFPYHSAEEIFLEHRESTRGRDLDITGLDYAFLDENGPQQWPCPEGSRSGKERLYEDGIFPTKSGKARFHPAAHARTAEETDARYPFHLVTGRLRDQWHSMTRTGRLGRLFSHDPEAALSMNPEDMKSRGLAQGDIVRVKSRRGEMLIAVKEDEDIRQAQVFIPMHWGGRFTGSFGVNGLTHRDFDPVSRQPELKHAAVSIEKVELAWTVTVLRSGDGLNYLEKVQPLLSDFDYVSCTLFGRDEAFFSMKAGCMSMPEQDLAERLDALLGMEEDACLSYRDAGRGIDKRVKLEGGQAVGVRLIGDSAAREWLMEMMASFSDVSLLRKWLLAPVSQPPAFEARGKIVCNCLDVSEKEILESGLDLEGLQEKFRCGTQCGSCLPEIRRLLADVRGG